MSDLPGTFGANDPRLDRLPQFDEASRAYPVRSLLRTVAENPLRSYTWYVPVALDQGTEGACVGFAWAHELAAPPRRNPLITAGDAQWIYHRAQDLDEWPGSDYSGTSVLAGAKATQERGGLVEYRWGFGLDDVLRTVGYLGPVVLGLNWYTGMMAPDSDGRIRPTGDLEGGHAIVFPRVRADRYSVPLHRRTAWLWNSWGDDWGQDGAWCWLTWDDLERLLSEQGEACVPVLRAA